MSAFDTLELLGNAGAVPSIPAGSNFLAFGQGKIETTGMDNQAISLFAQFDFQLGDRTTLTLGANYTEDEKDAFIGITGGPAGFNEFAALELDQVGYETIFFQLTGAPALPPFTAAFPVEDATAMALSTIACPAPAPLPPDACNPLLALAAFQFLPPMVDFPNSVEPGNSKDDQTTWTARLAFDWTDNVNVYVGAGTGFKATSWNLSRDSLPFEADIPALEQAGLTVGNLRAGTRYAGPEDSTVYEIGLKSRWDTGSLNMAAFAQEIEGFQSNLFTGIGFNFANAGKQSVDGVELELTWFPVEAFQFTFGGTWLDPVYDSFVGGAGVDGPEDLSGTKPAGIPEIAIVTTGQYNFDIGSSTQGFVRAEYIYEDEVQVNENVPTSVASREVSTFNASLGMRWQNGFEAMLWGRNLTDDEYLQSSFPSVAQPGSYSGYPNQPRTYGVTLRKYFD
jgi:outer membrane receptor protein involved in Fe transport